MKHSSPFPRFQCSASLLLVVLLGAGCAGIPTVLPPKAQATIRDTEVRSYIPQNSVNLQYMRSGYGSGLGLIGALVDVGVDSALSSSAEARAVRIRQVVSDYDFRGPFWEATSNVVVETPWLHTRSFTGLATNVIPVRKEAVAQGAVMNLGTDYFITPDHRVFVVDTGFSVFAPTKHKKPAAANMVFYHSARIGNEEGDKAAEIWMADAGAKYRRAATEGIQENARLLRYALAIMGGSPAAVGRPAKVKADFVHGRGGFGIPAGRVTVKGRILDESPDRILFHAEKGNLFSLPRAEVEIKYLD